MPMEPGDNAENATQQPRSFGKVMMIVFAVYVLVLFGPSLLREYFVFLVILVPFLILEVTIDEPTRSGIYDLLQGTVSNPNTAVSKIILSLFDRIYAFPMTGGPAEWTPLKAFLPSMFLTVIATFVLTFSFSMTSSNGVDTAFWSRLLDTAFWSGMVVNIISDYWALFVIRRRLDALVRQPDNKSNSREALLFATFAGILLVTSFTGLRLIFFMMTNLFLSGYPYDACAVCKEAADGHAWDVKATTEMWKHLRELHLPGVLAASIVHVWLPVFAFSAYMLKSLNKRLQTNLGQKHPVLVLGIFAVSAAAALAKLIRLLTTTSGI
jgi:hypothetical protein